MYELKLDETKSIKQISHSIINAIKFVKKENDHEEKNNENKLPNLEEKREGEKGETRYPF